MTSKKKLFSLVFSLFFLSSCVTKKAYQGLQAELDKANLEIGDLGATVSDYMNKLAICEQDKAQLLGQIRTSESESRLRQEQILDLREQLQDARVQRDRQVERVGDLTVLSQSANENIRETLSQLEKKDEYIQFLQLAKTKADSINLALAVNLKSVLERGIADEDIEIKVDKTVVFINISDKMLYRTGSYNLTDRAFEVLEKIAQIVVSRPELEVMIEGYTDNVPISTDCIDDNWDLSVKRATSVVRTLQNRFGVDPNRLIAAGRGEYNTLASNDTAEGRATNRRTRIILLPKLDQFYDLLNPNNIPK